MKINNSIFDPLRPERSVPSEGTHRPSEQSKPAAPAAPVARRDSVQISDSGRSMASRMDADSKATLDPDRVAELRQKVYEGAYNSLDVVDQVARRILTRGDL